MRDEVKAGVVILLSLLILAGLVIGVSGIRPWEHYDEYTVRLRSSGGLDQGAPVRLEGLKVGKVLRMRIPPEDRARVEITLGLRQGTVLPRGTWAGVATLGLLGDAYLQLTTETHSAEVIPPGSQIPAREAASIADLLQRLQGVATTADAVLAQAGTLLSRDAADLLRRATAVAEAAQQTLAHVDAFVAPANRARVERVLAGVDQVVQDSAASIRTALEHLEGASSRMEATTGVVQSVVEENRGDLREAVRLLRRDLEGTGEVLAKVEEALASLQQTMRHADNALLENRPGLDETLENLRRSSRNLRELSQGLKERPWTAVFPAAPEEKPGMEPRR
jgi:phospholipid/cholesterol/gamma-HCH transport system substrate-binding protein